MTRVAQRGGAPRSGAGRCRGAGVPGAAAAFSPSFTLIELMLVMLMATLLMAISLPSFVTIGRGAGMRSAVNNVRSTLSLARQWAITHREEIIFVASPTGLAFTTNMALPRLATNDMACYYAYCVTYTNPGKPATSIVQSLTFLPLDVTFHAAQGSEIVTSLTFKTDGGLKSGVIPKKVVLVDKRNPDLKRAVTVSGLTGGVRVED